MITARRILYEDDDLLAVDKPAGLVAHATVDRGRDHLIAALGRLLAGRDGAIGHLVAHHRLDKGTSGVVLFSRRAELDGALGAAFAGGEMGKTYLAVAQSRPGEPFPAGITEVDAYLATRRAAGRVEVVRAGGKPARTGFRLLAERQGLLLIEARPRTGRTHQIRVHLAHLGFPILGDELYGGQTSGTKRLLLHARSLGFAHPRTGDRLTVVAPFPRAFRSRFPDLRDPA